MNAIRKWIRNLFGFSGREVNGFLILLPLTVLAVMAQPLYTLWLSSRPDDFSRDEQRLDSLMTLWDGPAIADSADQQKLILFEFDPNKASVETFAQLGFSKNLSTRIANYRQKGGVFRVKRDLLKIYGLDSSLYAHIHAYILLPETTEKKFSAYKFPVHKREDRKESSVIYFDLNTADTMQLKSVYGIGPALALRIIRFREGLGGFTRRSQVAEVYGLDSATVNKLFESAFIAENFVPRKINLNQSNEKQLSSHPYITRSMASAIVAFRFQHGAFKQVEDLRKLTHLKSADIDKILPYLTVNE
jgi:competence protein ComEA